jgi:imidazolonepropionase
MIIPEEFRHDPDGYVDLIINSIIPQSQAKWIDVFCDEGAFNPDQTEAILRAGISHGLLPRIHANQLSSGKAVEIAIAVDAASADHLSKSTVRDIELLASSNTVATLLPGAEFLPTSKQISEDVFSMQVQRLRLHQIATPDLVTPHPCHFVLQLQSVSWDSL